METVSTVAHDIVYSVNAFWPICTIVIDAVISLIYKRKYCQLDCGCLHNNFYMNIFKKPMISDFTWIKKVIKLSFCEIHCVLIPNENVIPLVGANQIVGAVWRHIIEAVKTSQINKPESNTTGVETASFVTIEEKLPKKIQVLY